MKNSQNFIGIDLGGESGRVVSGGFDGQTMRLEEKHRFPTGATQCDSSLRWDVNKFWRAIEQGLSVVAKDTNDVVSIGVDSWGVDYALLNSDDELIDLPFHYRDSRNSGILDAILQRVSQDEIFSRTGIQFMEINTLCQLFASCRVDSTLNNASQLLTIADYFHWRLCGSKSIEFTFATTTQCFDPQTRTWAASLLEKLEIPTQILPEVVEPGTNLGQLNSDVAASSGLGSISVVAPATHDTASAVVAVPANMNNGSNWAYISSGTWSLVGVETDAPIFSEAALAANVTNEGGVDGTWRLLKNVMGLWLIQGLRSAFAKRGFDRTYEELTKLAGKAASTGCFVDPDDSMFLNPSDMEQAIVAFCNETGQVAPRDEAEMVRCVLESLALRYCQVLREIEALTDLSIDVIHVVGGGCKNILLNQFISGATRLPVIAGPSEATALGNVLVQCKAAGGLGTLQDIREVVGNSVELIKFEPTALTYWQDAMSRFESICKLGSARRIA